LLQDHLRGDCEYEKRKEFLIGNSKLRRELVVCTGCGNRFQLCELKKHEVESAKYTTAIA
jgi:hypothetical protein